MGLVFSAFTFAYAVCEIPGGWLADRFGTAVVMARVVLWWSLMTAATGLVGDLFPCFACSSCLALGRSGRVSRPFPRLFAVAARKLARQRVRAGHHDRAGRRRHHSKADRRTCSAPRTATGE